MKKMLRGRKRNNRGMSLVEVVVAIAVLSIVMLSVLHSFVYSARYNARSRERQQTTAAAQTVMENFKAYSVQEIWDQFQTYDPAIAGSGYHLNGGIGNYYEGTPGGNMKFQITGMQYQNEEYDVSISLTPHGSDASKINTLVYENPTQEHTAIYVGYVGMDAGALTGIMEDVAKEWSDREMRPWVEAADRRRREPRRIPPPPARLQCPIPQTRWTAAGLILPEEI